MDGNATAGFKAPYLSFQTYWNFLADLTSKQLPPKLDRSIMTNKSGSDQTAIMSALESFGFVDEVGTVQRDLTAFKEADEERRKGILREQLEVYYEPVLDISAKNGTPADLKQVFADRYEVSGDTQRKAITFFLHAAREAGIPLSDHFPKTRAGSGSPGTSKPAAKNGKKMTTRKRTGASTPPAPPAGRGQTHTIRLTSGGSVTLSIDVDMFTVDQEDMEFTLDLVQKLRAYKASHPDLADDTSATDSTEEDSS